MVSTVNEALIAIGRVLLAVPFVYSGIGKIERFARTAALMHSHGIPGAFLPLVIALEVGGGLALALGIFTRLICAALAVFSVAAITIFLLPDSRAITLILVEFAMVGGLCGFAARGGGRFSVDRIWMRSQHKH